MNLRVTFADLPGGKRVRGGSVQVDEKLTAERPTQAVVAEEVEKLVRANIDNGENRTVQVEPHGYAQGAFMGTVYLGSGEGSPREQFMWRAQVVQAPPAPVAPPQQ